MKVMIIARGCQLDPGKGQKDLIRLGDILDVKVRGHYVLEVRRLVYEKPESGEAPAGEKAELATATIEFDLP